MPANQITDIGNQGQDRAEEHRVAFRLPVHEAHPDQAGQVLARVGLGESRGVGHGALALGPLRIQKGAQDTQTGLVAQSPEKAGDLLDHGIAKPVFHCSLTTKE